MKKILFSTVVVAATLFACSTSVQAQSHALPRLIAMYGNVTNATVSEQAGNTVLFQWKEGGTSYRALFNKTGEWMNTIISYEASQLPGAIRSSLQAAWSEYKPVYVDELRFANQPTVYRVQLENPWDLLILQVSDETIVKERLLHKKP